MTWERDGLLFDPNNKQQAMLIEALEKEHERHAKAASLLRSIFLSVRESQEEAKIVLERTAHDWTRPILFGLSLCLLLTPIIQWFVWRLFT